MPIYLDSDPSGYFSDVPGIVVGQDPDGGYNAVSYGLQNISNSVGLVNQPQHPNAGNLVDGMAVAGFFLWLDNYLQRRKARKQQQ